MSTKRVIQDEHPRYVRQPALSVRWRTNGEAGVRRSRWRLFYPDLIEVMSTRRAVLQTVLTYRHGVIGGMGASPQKKRRIVTASIA